MHDTIGHGTQNQSKNDAARLFFCPSLPKEISNVIKSCPQCQFLSRNKKNKAEDFDIPMPEYIGAQILIDEISRQFKQNETWRFVVAWFVGTGTNICAWFKKFPKPNPK